MKYIFFLGRIGEISFAEIHAMLSKYQIQYEISRMSDRFLIIDVKDPIDAPDMLIQMGGTIKISEYSGEFETLEDSLAAARDVISKLVEARESKKVIGYNIYFSRNEEKDKVQEISGRVNEYFSGLKKELATKTSMRLVYPDRSGEINSVSIIKNKFLKKGVVLDFIFFEDRIVLSKLSAIQDVDSYSERDYGRPERDALIGMTPPKLAQIMINLAQPKDGAVVYDPFCGVGTIMQEALLNDCRAVGSDANSAQVEKCKKNLGWISKKYILKYPDYKVFQSDSAHAYKKLNENSVDVIITETTLGPIYTKAPKNQEINQNFKQIQKLYLRFFENSKIILRNKAKMVFTVPAYQVKPDKYVLAPFIDNIEKIGYSIVSLADKKLFAKSTRITERSTIIYSRPDQIVAREIIMFEKK